MTSAERIPKRYRLGKMRRGANVIVARLIIAGIFPHRCTYVMTTVGRKSGKRWRTPVTLIESGNGRWLVAAFGSVGWVHNVRASHEVLLQRGRRRQRLHADEVGIDIAAKVLQQYVGRFPTVRAYFRGRPGDPIERFTQDAHSHAVFALTPFPADPASGRREP